MREIKKWVLQLEPKQAQEREKGGTLASRDLSRAAPRRSFPMSRRRRRRSPRGSGSGRLRRRRRRGRGGMGSWWARRRRGEERRGPLLHCCCRRSCTLKRKHRVWWRIWWWRRDEGQEIEVVWNLETSQIIFLLFYFFPPQVTFASGLLVAKGWELHDFNLKESYQMRTHIFLSEPLRELCFL